jgi:hypothetical protein
MGGEYHDGRAISVLTPFIFVEVQAKPCIKPAWQREDYQVRSGAPYSGVAYSKLFALRVRMIEALHVVHSTEIASRSTIHANS